MVGSPGGSFGGASEAAAPSAAAHNAMLASHRQALPGVGLRRQVSGGRRKMSWEEADV